MQQVKGCAQHPKYKAAVQDQFFAFVAIIYSGLEHPWNSSILVGW